MGPLRSTFFVLFLLVTLAVPPKVFADHRFYYDNVFVCGPQKVLRVPPDEITQDGRSQHFFMIHDNKGGDKYSIVWGEEEYPSFKVNHYTKLYFRNGGDYWSTFQRLSNSKVKFELHSDYPDPNKLLIIPAVPTLSLVLTFNMATMSAVREDWMGNKRELTCWNYKKRWEQ